MKIQSFLNQQVIDKNGYFTTPWREIIAQLLQQLQNNLSDEGFIMPSNTTTDIEKFTSKNGAVFYDKDTDKLKACIGGVIKTFTLT